MSIQKRAEEKELELERPDKGKSGKSRVRKTKGYMFPEERNDHMY